MIISNLKPLSMRTAIFSNLKLSKLRHIQAERNQFRIPFHRGKDREPLQAVSESNGGVRYGEIKRFIRAGMYGADRNSGASGEALRYAAGSYLFPRLL